VNQQLPESAEKRSDGRAGKEGRKKGGSGGAATARRKPPSSEIAIKASNVRVEFRPFMEKRPTLRRHGLAQLSRRGSVVAVDGVSLTVRRGEALGIIGSNGAGKSTLLQVLAGTLPPDEGKVEVFGSPPMLLSLGLGFIRNLSGRRNILLGGLAVGLHKAEIEEMMDEIIEYSELGKAIERPVMTYSSGMYSRLSFAVAIRSQPEILLLDEVLSVGDEAFKKKSLASMLELLNGAGTIVMVSHGLGRVARFCHRLAWIDQGKLVKVGQPHEIVDAYRRHIGTAKEDVGDDDD
jgi:teichoic acid transport system ATP-binding protein